MHLVEFPGTTRNTVPGNDLPPAQDEYAVTVSVNAIAIYGTRYRTSVSWEGPVFEIFSIIFSKEKRVLPDLLVAAGLYLHPDQFRISRCGTLHSRTPVGSSSIFCSSIYVPVYFFMITIIDFECCWRTLPKGSYSFCAEDNHKAFPNNNWATAPLARQHWIC